MSAILILQIALVSVGLFVFTVSVIGAVADWRERRSNRAEAEFQAIVLKDGTCHFFPGGDMACHSTTPQCPCEPSRLIKTYIHPKTRKTVRHVLYTHPARMPAPTTEEEAPSWEAREDR